MMGHEVIVICLEGLASLALAVLGWKFRAVTWRGGIAGGLLLAIVWHSTGWRGACLLGLFVITSTMWTRFSRKSKLELGLVQVQGGARTAKQVLANGSVPGLMALAYGIWGHPAALAAYAGSLAAATADTWGSEVGQGLASRVWVFGTLRTDKAGVEGGVSFMGSLAALCGASVIAGAAWFFGYGSGLAAITTAGIVGAFTDSLLGSTLEERGFLGNEAVNFICTLAGAGTALGAHHAFYAQA